MTKFRGLAYALFGATATALFMLTSLYGIGFIGNVVVPKSVDSGAPGPWLAALLVDMLLIVLFSLQHSVMARPGFKRQWTRIVPGTIERSTYILSACLVLGLLFWLWRPMPQIVWSSEQPIARASLTALFWVGWLAAVLAGLLTNQLELLGWRQILDYIHGRGASDPTLTTSGPYRLVRHPIYVGSLIGFWATPDMTAGHLLFSIAATTYTILGAFLEERDLVTTFGDRYRNYQRTVRMLLPFPK